MVYDSYNGKVVLFGGATDTQYLNDIWEFDVATKTWTNVTPTSGPMPTPRGWPAMAYDPVRRKIVMHGGVTAPFQHPGDTWEWDTVTRSWALMPSGGIDQPNGLLGSAMAFDPNLNQVILFGGRHYYDNGVPATYAWNGNNWTNISPPTSPSGRAFSMMATDTARSKVVLFGGWSGGQKDDTWEWNGSTWTQMTTPVNPGAREAAGMSYDSEHGYMLLFGGWRGQAPDDTWTWDGQAWTLQQPCDHPSGRSEPSMAYDPVRKRHVLFGGVEAAGIIGETWFYGTGLGSFPCGDTAAPVTTAASTAPNGAGWNTSDVTVQLNASDGPNGSGVEAITYSASGAQSINTTTVNGSSTSFQITAEGVTAITYFARDYVGNAEELHTLVVRIDKTAPNLSIPSGLSVGASNNSGTAVSYQALASDALDPSPTVSCSPVSGSVFAMGSTQVICTATDRAGNSTTSNFTVWVTLDLGFDWYNIATDSPRPSPRGGHGMVYDPVHAKIVLFGGRDSTGTRNDIWEFDTATRRWIDVTPLTGAAPVQRSNFGMAYDESRGVIVIYGGDCGTNCLEFGNVQTVADTWEWNTTTRSWRKGPNTIPVFAGMKGPALAYDPTRQQVICFGGKPYWEALGVNQSWAWNGTSWTEITPAGPLPDPRRDHSMSLDTDRNRIVMFGPYEDTWEWDGTRWSAVGLSGPHPTWKSGVKMAYDKLRKKTILFGGSNQYGAFDETWEWNGVAWTRLAPLHAPPARGFTGLVYDDSQGKLVMFGGDQLTDDTWISGPADQLAPTSQAFLSPSPNAAGWNHENVTVAINAADDPGGSGVQRITYSAAGAQTVSATDVNGSSAPILVSAEGETTILFSARDIAGNVEATRTLTVRIDKTAPLISGTPEDQTAEATSAAGASISWASLTVQDNLDGNPSLSCSSASGTTFPIGTTLVTCSSIDQAGNSSAVSFNVTVRDATAPVISGTPGDIAVTAASASGAAVSYASPTAIDTVDGAVTVNCSPASGQVFAHGLTTVTCIATDSHQNSSATHFIVRVNDAPPTASAGGPYRVSEGRSVSLSGSGADVEGTTLIYYWDLDDNGTFETAGQSPVFSAAGLDGPTSRQVKLRVTDAAGLSTVSTATVDVLNVAPTLVLLIGPIAPQAVNTVVNMAVNYNDPAGALDRYTVTTDWGDGIISSNTSHIYSAAGVYRIQATVADDDGGISNQGVYEFVVIYDPSAGFVTGGGWIISPAGALVANPSLSGKATFGFVSKYQNGASQPTGNTEFQFQTGDFRFKSDSYDWLVISGAKAQYKGSGSVNGVPGYSFILTATDGQINGGGGSDKFRIKIWNPAGIVYDNVVGASDQINEASPQAVGGGSIIIQSR
jgi:hypothetical protein